jgi:O-antigen/teichoic acid export membrane protein
VALVVLLYVAGPLQRGLETVPVLLLVVAALPLISLVAVLRSTAQGLGAFGRVGIIQAFEVTAKFLVGISLAALGFGAVGAVAGIAAGALLAVVVGIALVLPSVQIRGRAVQIPAVGSVAPMFMTLLALGLILNVDLMAMKLIGPSREATGQYQAAIILANAPYFLVSAAVVPVMFTRLSGASRLGETRGRVAEALRLAVALALPFEILLVAIPDAALGLLFPPAYAAAAPIVRMMAIGNGLLMIVVVLAAAFQAIGRASEVGRVLLGVAAAEVVALALLVPRFGGAGAVSAFVGACVAATLIIVTLYTRRAGVEPAPVLSWVRRLAVPLAAGGATVALLAAIGQVIAGIIAAGAVYYGLVVALNLVPELRLPSFRVRGALGREGRSPAAMDPSPITSAGPTDVL